MYVVIGDPHFTDETVGLKNIPSYLLSDFLDGLRLAVKRVRPKKIKFVLNGDIFDLITSLQWNYEIKDGKYRYSKKLTRPWDNDKEKVLKKARTILQQILATEDLRIFLQNFKEFCQEIAIPVEIYYVSRNHDYLIEAFPELRKMVVEAFGLVENKNFFFKDVVYDESLELYISHGNEYDSITISEGPEGAKTATFGDAMMIEIHNRLPVEIFVKTGKKELFGELAGIQEVRPQRAALSFIRKTVKKAGVKESVFEGLVLEILNECFKNEFITDWLKSRQLRINLRPRAFFLYQIFIPFFKILGKLRLIRKHKGIDKIAANIYKVFELELRENLNSIQKAKLTDLLKVRKIKYFVFNHTHDFEKSMLNGNLVYLNLGTWLIQHHKTNSEFQTVRNPKYGLFFEEGEEAEKEFEIKTVKDKDF